MNQSSLPSLPFPTSGRMPKGVTFPCPTLPIAKLSSQIFMDARGIFCELHRIESLKPLLGSLRFVQANLSKSNAYIVRGMHYQHGLCGKLLRCISGSIFQVSVDVQADSSTFGQFHGEFLSDKTMDAIWVPPGFANGFMALEMGATVLYEMTAYYDAALERQLAWNCKEVGIRWPGGRNTPITVSPKDRAAPRLGEIDKWRLLP